MLQVKHKELEEMIGEHYEHKIPIYIWGETGIGKSDTVRKKAEEIAKSRKREYIEWNKLNKKQKNEVLVNPKKYFFLVDVRLSMCDPSDLKGIPQINGVAKSDELKAVEWQVPMWMFLANMDDAEGIIFFDEINLAPQSVQSSSYQLINDRALGEVSLADGVMCISAGNRLEDMANVYDLGRPLRNRFTHVTLISPSITDKCENDWGEWAMINGVDVRIVTFLMQNPRLLNPKLDKHSDEMAFPTPRSWGKFCSPLISGKEDISIIERYASESVGESVAKEFTSFLRLKRKVNLKEILEDPTKVKEITETDLKFSLLSLLSEWYFAERDLPKKEVTKTKNKKDESFKPMDKILGITDFLTPDFSITLLRIIRGRDQTKFIKEVLDSKHYEKFSSKFKKYFFDLKVLL